MGDYILKSWKEAGLPKPLKIRMKFATVDRSIIVRKIGSVDEEDRDQINTVVRSFFGS
jgi:hypothetical protein